MNLIKFGFLELNSRYLTVWKAIAWWIIWIAEVKMLVCLNGALFIAFIPKKVTNRFSLFLRSRYQGKQLHIFLTISSLHSKIQFCLEYFWNSFISPSSCLNLHLRCVILYFSSIFSVSVIFTVNGILYSFK